MSLLSNLGNRLESLVIFRGLLRDPVIRACRRMLCAESLPQREKLSACGEFSSLLLEHGLILSMTPVLAVVVPDEPGALGKILALLARENIDVEYVYSVFGQVQGQACMIFRVADLDRLAALLKDNGMPPALHGELGIQDEQK